MSDLMTSSAARSIRSGQTVPVIVDDGSSAEVVVVCFPHQPRRGERFRHGGRTWEIVREKDHVRGFVAYPVAAAPANA